MVAEVISESKSKNNLADDTNLLIEIADTNILDPGVSSTLETPATGDSTTFPVVSPNLKTSKANDVVPQDTAAPVNLPIKAVTLVETPVAVVQVASEPLAKCLINELVVAPTISSGVPCHKNHTSHSLSSTKIGNYCLTDYDLTLCEVLPELFSAGYRVVQNQRNNITFTFGSIYSKKCKGLPVEHGFFFIEALIVTSASDSADLCPINFIFAKQEQVTQFCLTKGEINLIA